MKQKIIFLFLTVLQIIAGCLAAIAFFVLIYNGSSNQSVILVLAIAILGFVLGIRGLIMCKKK